MIPDKIFEIGAMLGLQREDIQNIVSDKLITDAVDDLEAPSSPVDTYPKGTDYGTVSIKDFQ